MVASTGSAKKSKAKSTAKKTATQKAADTGPIGGIRLDPDLPLIPGNSVSFVAEERPGRVQAKIVTARETWMIAASNGGGDARVTKILETGGDITVSFYEDGKLYASDTWSVS